MKDDPSVIYLSQISRRLMDERHPLLGVLVTPDSSRSIPAGMLWAADNGCFTRGDRFDLGRYLRWLKAPRGDLDRCLFAAAPDVVGDAAATWARSASVLPTLRELGYRAALVAQDGFDPGTVDWSAFDVLFIGGTTRWKRSDRGGFQACADALQRGKRVHVGRVNGQPFLRHVTAAGADSADGTQLTYTNMWPRTKSWLDRLLVDPPQGRPMELFAW